MTRCYRALPNILLLALIFGVSYGQFPLYYQAQNQYFFYGLEKAGYGLLRDDWLAKTANPWPVFTLLVDLSYRYLDLRLMYVYFLLLLGVYAYSLLGIASSAFRIESPRSRYLAYIAVLTVLHSPLLASLSTQVLGFNVSRGLIEGVASQRILWDMFQPGAFGAFLLLSIHLFLRGRPFAAVVSLAVAAMFNPVYVFSAGALTFSYMFVMVKRGEKLKRPLGLGLLALGLVLPLLVYMYREFGPTSPDLWARAQDILVHARLSRHAVVARWFDSTVYPKIAVILAALYVLRRRECFWIVFLPFTIAAGLTVVQALSRSNSLALLYPWRLSVFLVPLSASLVIAYALPKILEGAERRFPGGQKALAALSLATILAFVAAGGIVTRQRFASPIAPETVRVMTFVRQTRSPGETYLIPVGLGGRGGPFSYASITPDWRQFRLFTGAVAFVDYWFNPYDDAAVVEWYKRMRLGDAFYAAHRDRRCQLARELSSAYQVTHVVLGAPDPAVCENWKLLVRDEHYGLYAIQP